MSFTATLFDSGQLFLEITERQREIAWQQSQSLATPNSRWQAYLNGLALGAVLPWLQEELAETQGRVVTPQPSDLLATWELVNGTPLGLKLRNQRQRRLVLVPDEAMDLEELAVPQEWLEITNWAADDFVAVQVNPDEGWVRLWGWASRSLLQEKAELDWSDRTYRLPQEALSADLGILTLALDLASTSAIATPLETPPVLDLANANSLIERLGNPAELRPRLAIPFERWAGLMAHSGYRQRLAERRWGIEEGRSPLSWLRSGLSALAEQSGWRSTQLAPAMAGVRGLETVTPTLIRDLTIDHQPYELCITALGDPPENCWRFSLRSANPQDPIPMGFVLRLLTEDLQNFDGNEDRATAPVAQLWIDVQLAPGEGIVWQVEPEPEGYSAEILRF